METNGTISNSPRNTDHPANGSGTNLNATPLGRSITEPFHHDCVRKRSRSIFGCLGLRCLRKSKSCTQIRQESPFEPPKVMVPWICAIDSANRSTPVSTLTLGDSLSGDPLEHAPNLRSVRPLMSGAQFSRHRNSLSTKISRIPMIETQNFNDVKGYHRRCRDPTEMDFQAVPVSRDASDLNRTAPVIPEEITLTMDESKRELRASQEFLANRHFSSRKGQELGDRVRTKREDTMTKDRITVHVSGLVNDEYREQTKFSEIAPKSSMERPISDVGESRDFIFSELYQSLGRAIEFLGQREVWKREKIAKAIHFAEKEIGHDDCLLAQLVKTRKMIETRLKIASSGPEFILKGSPTVSPITIEAHCASSTELSPKARDNFLNSPKYDPDGFPLTSPIHSGTSTSPNGTCYRPLHNSMNKDDWSPGNKKMLRTLRLCTPTPETADQFFEYPSTNCDRRPTPDTQRPTRESTPLRPFGYRYISRNPSLDATPVGVQNSNIGTTCYINAGLQLLASVPEILYRVEEGIQFLISEGSPDMEACVAYKNFMEDTAREYSKPNKQKDAISNSTVADMMFKIYPDKFKPYEEEDCGEFVTLLLQQIHEELGEVLSPSVLFTGEQRRFHRKASRAIGRNDGTSSSDSPPPAKEEFNVIPLHFTARHRKIEDSFDSYTTEEPSPDEEFHHWCKFEVLPPLLLVQVQSYDDSKPIPKKALREVPVDEILQFRKEWMYEAPGAARVLVPSNDSFGILISDDLEKDCASKRVLAAPPLYQIRAVVFHDGRRTTTGHYTAAVFLPDRHGQRMWYYCDDHYIKEYSRKSLNQRAKDSQVTLLLYERQS